MIAGRPIYASDELGSLGKPIGLQLILDEMSDVIQIKYKDQVVTITKDEVMAALMDAKDDPADRQ